MGALKSSLGTSLAFLFCFAASGAGATELRDVATLTVQEQEGLMRCTLSEMSKDRSAEIAQIRAEHASKSSKPAPEDPLFEAMVDIALSLQLGQLDCAKKMGIDPRSLPGVTFK